MTEYVEKVMGKLKLCASTSTGTSGILLGFNRKRNDRKDNLTCYGYETRANISLENFKCDKVMNMD